MIKPSPEQQHIVDELRLNQNVSVDACAGSGKSTTILSVAREFPDKQIIQFTYNSMLRREIKEKVRELSLRNLEVHTYHSFAVKYYSCDAYTDTGIRHCLCTEDVKPKQCIPKFDIVVLDETQDMTPLYFELVVTMLRDMCEKSGHTFQMLILGDYMQGLYEFKGADTRFLTDASTIWCELTNFSIPYLKTHEFSKCSLKTSYRVTNQMANFVNNDMLGEDRLIACREGCPVIYIRRPKFQIEQIVVYRIKRLLAEGESPSDIFVLGGSVKGTNSHIRHMENVLTDANIPCHVPMMESDIMDERVIDGKVVFSTFHTVKGRQRKHVFVVGFDQGYFYNARNVDTSICPNTLYVACTRATHGLYLLENNSSRPLEFLKNDQYDMNRCDYIDFKGVPQTIFHEPVKDKEEESGIVIIPTYHVTPTDLIKFISESTTEMITPILDRVFVQEVEPENDSELDIPRIVEVEGGLFEEVSDLNGIALPAIYYDEIQQHTKDGQDILKTMIQQQVSEMKENKYGYLKQMVAELPEQCVTPGDYLFLSNLLVAVQERLYSKLKQIPKSGYNWITPEMKDKCVERLNANLGHEFKKENNRVEIEKQLIHYSNEVEHNLIDAALYPFFSYEKRFRFSGRLDMLTSDNIWELKCTSKISVEHQMQVVIYDWLWRTIHPDCPRTVYIYNIRTNEKQRVNATYDDLTQIVVPLLRNKYEENVRLSDSEFVEQCSEKMTRILG